jgi:hypothetical protein
VSAELALPVYRRISVHVKRADGDDRLFDSNKDGGYLAANWALYRAQESIARTCEAHGVALTIFHGRGGTVARGGGPASRAIRAQPPGTLRGRFRVTEQGETIASRYADLALAHRHVDQIVSAVLLASRRRPPRHPAAWHAAWTRWRWRRDAYRGLVEGTRASSTTGAPRLHRRDRRNRLASHGPPRRRYLSERGPGHSLGLLLDAEPFQSARVVPPSAPPSPPSRGSA